MTVDLRRLDALREEGWSRLYPSDRIRASVGLGTCGKAAGAKAVFDSLVEFAQDSPLPMDVVPVGCAGACWAEPLVSFALPGRPRAVYGNMDSKEVRKTAEEVCRGQYPAEGLLGFVMDDRHEGWGDTVRFCDPGAPDDTFIAGASANSFDDRDVPLLSDLDFFSKQSKRLTSLWGVTSPGDISEYVATGGYYALSKALSSMGPDDVIQSVVDSGLRGRGGAGFPTGRKWEIVSQSPQKKRYVIANADEGDPGAYMDRGLMESDPHRLIEGMVIASYALGAHEGYVFTRTEYGQAIHVLDDAIAQAEKAGLLGDDILGSGHSFHLRIVRSAGAFVCGEESAMLEALEGRRPDPQKRPPYPSEEGLESKPTCINNVETFANIPSIIMHGAEAFRSVGTPDSSGTKIFSLSGSIEHAGLVEVPFGIPLSTIVNTIACVKEEPLRNVVCEQDASNCAIQIGGPSGGIVPLTKDVSLGYEELEGLGASVGSGGIVVLGPLACVADTVKYFLQFSLSESCGQCVACQRDLKRSIELMEQVCRGTVGEEALEELDVLTQRIPKKARCSLCKLAVRPLRSALDHFKGVLHAHLEGRCPGLVCKDSMHFEVIERECPGCLCCMGSCPTNAIKGSFGKPFIIDQDKCIKCWMCVDSCPYPALMAFPVRGSDQNPIVEAEGPCDEDSRRDECVFCGRCVEVCKSQGTGILYVAGRGANRHIALIGEAESPDCVDCSACSDACPTGVIADLLKSYV